MSKQLIKSVERVRDLGEVFTPDFLVEQMLDQFPSDAWEPYKNWLEPTCGNGQFIIGVLRRKIQRNLTIMKPFNALMTALDTTFGTDIMDDNISDCRIRIYKEIVIPHWRQRNVYSERRVKQRWQVVCAVCNNIRHTADALQEDYTKFQYFEDLEAKKREDCIIKVQHMLLLIDNGTDIKNIANSNKRLYTELLTLGQK